MPTEKTREDRARRHLTKLGYRQVLLQTVDAYPINAEPLGHLARRDHGRAHPQARSNTTTVPEGAHREDKKVWNVRQVAVARDLAPFYTAFGPGGAPPAHDVSAKLGPSRSEPDD